MPSKIEITHKTIIFTVFFLVFLWFIYTVRDVIFLLFISFILMSALKPFVEFMEKFRIPRIISILITYIIFLALVIFAGSSFIPPLSEQSVRLGENIPEYLRIISPYFSFDYNTVAGQFGLLGGNIFKVTVSVFSDIIGFFTVLVITLYLLLERKYLENLLSGFLGTENAASIVGIFHKVEERLGAWVRGQIALGFTIGLMSALALSLLNLPYVLPLAIIAGILELIPNIGPIVSAIPAIIIAFTMSPILAGLVALTYFLIQQLENHLIVPFVMKKVVGVPPLITIVALLIGAKIAGIQGVLLSVPVVVTVETVMSEYYRIRTKGTESGCGKI